MELAYIATILPSILRGLATTLQLFFMTLIFALPLGLVFTLGSISRFYPLKWVSKTYILVFRGTPLMLQLFFIYYGLPFLGVTLDNFPSAVLTFVLNYAAYFAEIYRAGITPGQTMRLIIIPQAVSRIIPPVCNETITLVKDTALVTAIGVGEMLKAAKGAVNRDMNITAYIVVAIIYLLLTLVLTKVYEKLEVRYNRYQKKGV